MHEVFNCGDINTDGICRSVCARWLYTCTKKGGSVTDVDELGTRQFIKLLWDAAGSDPEIDKNNLLNEVSRAATKAGQPFQPSWMATQLTMGNGKAIMTAWDNSLKGGGGAIAKVRSGHSMATNRINGKIQFLDPNTSCWEFNNSVEFYNYLPGYISQHYAELVRWQGIIYKYG